MSALRIPAFAAAALLALAPLAAPAQAVPDVHKPAAAADTSSKPATKKKPVKKKVAKKKSTEKKTTTTAEGASGITTTAAAPAPAQAPNNYTTGPTVLRDKQGNVIPTTPDAYPVDSARRK